MFKPFKPREISPATREEISQSFQRGDFHYAVKQCKKAGYQLDDFQSDIETGAYQLLLWHRPATILSFIYRYGICIQYDISTLLLATFDLGDYHGFLNNAYRFKVHVGLDEKIEHAIGNVMHKGNIASAQAWQRKFRALREQES